MGREKKLLPSKSWDAYEALLRAVGEHRTVDNENDIAFLAALGLIEEAPRPATRTGRPTLTTDGSRYFTERFIRKDAEAATQILKVQIAGYPPAAAVVQFLAGIKDADRSTAETVLRSQGIGGDLTDRKLGSLLMLMGRAGLIKYAKNKGTISVLAQPAADASPPPSIFVSPETPFGNRAWLRRILQECEGFIYWLDKHFMPTGLEFLWEAADGNRISEIRVLSLALPDNTTKRGVKDYKRLQMELGSRPITFEWRVIDSKGVKATHDRWVIGQSTARNIPNLNAILSGQHSEINRSDQHQELKKLFEAYWREGVPIDTAHSGDSAAAS